MANVKVSQWTKVNLCSGIVCGRDFGKDFMFSCFVYRFPNAINICDTSLTMGYTGLNKEHMYSLTLRAEHKLQQAHDNCISRCISCSKI